jgi:uncharacterized protein with HEPN domain
MIEAARKAVGFAAGRSRLDLDADELFALAATRLVEILGEAARHVPDDFRDAHPEVPWRAVAGTRDKLIHGYFDVDYDILWEILSKDLPALIPLLESLTHTQTE